MRRYMYDKSLILQLLIQIEEAIRRVELRSESIQNPDDFTKNDEEFR